MTGTEFAEIRVPSQAKYILPIRLFLAGIAVRMDFPAETIEDIKMAAAEACSIILSGAADNGALVCSTREQEDHSLLITITVEGELFPSTADELSRAVLEAMSDACSLSYCQGKCKSISICFKN